MPNGVNRQGAGTSGGGEGSKGAGFRTVAITEASQGKKRERGGGSRKPFLAKKGTIIHFLKGLLSVFVTRKDCREGRKTFVREA